MGLPHHCRIDEGGRLHFAAWYTPVSTEIDHHRLAFPAGRLEQSGIEWFERQFRARTAPANHDKSEPHECAHSDRGAENEERTPSAARTRDKAEIDAGARRIIGQYPGSETAGN